MRLDFKFFNDRKKLLGIIFFAAVLIQVIFLSFLPNSKIRNQSADYKTFYKPLAENILAGRGFIDSVGDVSDRYPPGYPVFLAGIFKLAKIVNIYRLDLIAIFNVLFTALACVFLYLIGEVIFNKVIGFISALLWMSYPFNLWLIKQPNSEVPFICVFFIAIYFFCYSVKNKRYNLLFFCGIFLALALLFRSIISLCPLICILFIFFIKDLPITKRFLYSFVLIAGFVIILFPWQIYLFKTKGTLTPVSAKGLHSGMGDGLTFAIKPGAGGDRIALPKDVEELMQRIFLKTYILNTAGKKINYLIGEFQEYPLAVTKLAMIKIARSWYATDEMWHERRILSIQIIYILMAIIGLVLAFKKYRDKIYYISFLLAIMFYFWAMTTLVLSILRFMVPIMSFLLIFCAVFIGDLLERFYLKKSYG